MKLNVVRNCPVLTLTDFYGTWNGHTNLTNSSSTDLLQKLTVAQLVKKDTTFYGTRMFITVLTSALHLSLPCDRSIQSTHSPTIPLISNIIFPSTYTSSKLSVLSGFPIVAPYAPLLSPYVPHASNISFSWYDHRNSNWWRAEIVKIHSTQNNPAPCYFIPLRPRYLPRQSVLITMSAYVTTSITEATFYAHIK